MLTRTTIFSNLKEPVGVAAKASARRFEAAALANLVLASGLVSVPGLDQALERGPVSAKAQALALALVSVPALAQEPGCLQAAQGLALAQELALVQAEGMGAKGAALVAVLIVEGEDHRLYQGDQFQWVHR
jgi:hypothetical protein